LELRDGGAKFLDIHNALVHSAMPRLEALWEYVHERGEHIEVDLSRYTVIDPTSKKKVEGTLTSHFVADQCGQLARAFEITVEWVETGSYVEDVEDARSPSCPAALVFDMWSPHIAGTPPFHCWSS